MQQRALALPPDQAAVIRPEIFLRVSNQARHQFTDPVPPACRDLEVAFLPIAGAPASLSRLCPRGLQIDLVPHRPYRRGAPVRMLLVPRIAHPQYQVRLSRPRPGAPHALLLDGIFGFANPGGVDQGHRIAVEIELYFDDVTRGTGMGR